jgi:hypothetical protein
MKMTSSSTEQKRRSFPFHTLEDALGVAQKISDEMAGRPFNRLLLAEALGLKPSSTNYRDLLSSSYKYGLTEGTEKAEEISLTELGRSVTQTDAPSTRMDSLRDAVLTPPLFKQFFEDYRNKKLPTQMFSKILTTEYHVAPQFADECVNNLSFG